jgi:hypothetical protein
MVNDGDIGKLIEATLSLEASLMSLLISFAAFRRLGQLDLRNVSSDESVSRPPCRPAKELMVGRVIETETAIEAAQLLATLKRIQRGETPEV